MGLNHVIKTLIFDEFIFSMVLSLVMTVKEGPTYHDSSQESCENGARKLVLERLFLIQAVASCLSCIAFA